MAQPIPPVHSTDYDGDQISAGQSTIEAKDTLQQARS